MKLTVRNANEEVVGEADIPAEWFSHDFDPGTGDFIVTVKPEHMLDVTEAFVKAHEAARKEKPCPITSSKTSSSAMRS